MTLTRMKSRRTSSVSDMPQDLAALRGLLDARLAALETALADPNQHGSLEQIILDLARVATEEAEAAARQAYLDAQREGQGALAAARAEARAALEAEQAAAASARAELDQAQAAHQRERAAAASVRVELDQAQAAVQQERAAGASIRAKLDQVQAAVQEERTAAASLRAELDQMQTALQQERAAGAARERDVAALRHTLEQEQAARSTAIENESIATAALQQQLAQLQAAHQSERNADVARERGLAAVQQALEQELKQEQTAHANLRRELEDARAAAVSVQQALEQAQAALQTERAGAGRDQDLAAARDALEKELKREQTAHAKLREQFEIARGTSDRDRAKDQTDLERRASDAEARATAATREHQRVLAELDAVKQTASATEADAKARYEKLRDSADQQIRSIQLRVNEADQRAMAAESDLELLRRDAKTRDASAESDAAVFAPPPRAPAEAGAPPATSGPVRAAKRTAMSGEVDIQIDGHASKLIDLSTTGAQILSPGALKPNRLITLILPFAEGRVSCKGKIMWSKLEPGRKGGLWYRAGISFTSADEAGIEQFLNHESKGKK